MKLLVHSISFLRFGFSVCFIGWLKGQPLSILVLFLSILVLGSDMLDGWLARKYHVESVAGSWIDFLSDFSWLMAWFIYWDLSRYVLVSLAFYGGLYIISSRIVRIKSEPLVKDVLGKTLCAFLMAWPVIHYAVLLIGLDISRLAEPVVLTIILVACLTRTVLLSASVISRYTVAEPVYHVFDDFTAL